MNGRLRRQCVADQDESRVSQTPPRRRIPPRRNHRQKQFESLRTAADFVPRQPLRIRARHGTLCSPSAGGRISSRITGAGDDCSEIQLPAGARAGWVNRFGVAPGGKASAAPRAAIVGFAQGARSGAGQHGSLSYSFGAGCGQISRSLMAAARRFPFLQSRFRQAGQVHRQRPGRRFRRLAM